jgi:hypothetical protein
MPSATPLALATDSIQRLDLKKKREKKISHRT